MLTVITPATSTALTTLSRARAVLGFATTDDPAATVFIGQASGAIVDHCQRPFGLETVRETFAWDQLRADGPLLSRAPVVEILSVRHGDELLPAGSCAIDPRTGRLRRLDANGSPLPWWGYGLSVDYRGGYVLPSDATGAPASTLPAPVERTAVLMLATYLSLRQRDLTVKSDQVEGIGSRSYWVPVQADRLASPEAAQLLTPYVRFYP